MEYSTVDTLTAQLRALGVRRDGVLLVHSSYKSLGHVIGGPQAVVEALLAAAGTLVVPTHTPENSDPAAWAHPPVPPSWWEPIRIESPGFDPARTPASRWMGRLAELVRTWPGARRSDHPQVSFAAVGPRAAAVVDGHSLTDNLGEASPLGAIYRMDGQVLLLGVHHDANTSLHLGEARQPSPPMHTTGSSVRGRGWTTWTEVDVDAGDFGVLGEALEETGVVTLGPVGAATGRLMPQRAAADFATAWIPVHRAG
ncbi:AAC(3) family N-acetyltransferase [Actinoplanes sp. NPDC051411]|uniref:aminoglycoside N(3)-acetyltransferase n=1 Tax=Actinoplanes sp. NPDC051411 TaxID=3155522 RepID=UPI0034347497